MKVLEIDSYAEFMPVEEIKRNVLSNYNLNVQEIENIKFKDTNKQRAVFKIKSDKGMKCLKKVFYDEPNLLFVYSVTEWLNIKNILCPRLISTKKGHKFVNYNNNLFILTDWIEGRKCDYNNIDDIMKIAENLGKIHIRSKGFKPIEGSLIKEPDNSYYTSISKHFYQMLEFWNKAWHINDLFSQIYMKNFEYYYMRAKESVELLESMDFSKPLGDAVSNRAICHLDYVNKNLIFTPDNKLFVIDFDNTRIDMPVHDICYFLRRILKRDSTSWDFDIFVKAMENYESVRPLSRNEYTVILSLLMFPQKFWKVSRDYYKNRKECNRESFVNLIGKVVKHQDEHNVFCENLKLYIKEKFKE